jgi:adenosylcobyric acid synthase
MAARRRDLADGKVFGCYLHGLFGASGFRQKFGSLGVEASGVDHRAAVDAALDEIAAELEKYLDIDAILNAAR